MHQNGAGRVEPEATRKKCNDAPGVGEMAYMGLACGGRCLYYKCSGGDTPQPHRPEAGQPEREKRHA